LVLVMHLIHTVNVRSHGYVHEVDASVEAVVGFGHIEGVLVAHREVVEARAALLLRVSHVIVLFVTLLAVVASDALGRTVTLA
jgi:hypothetical protein